MFDLEKFKTGKYFIHLPTRKAYDDTREYLKKNKMSYPLRDYWEKNRSNTCMGYDKFDGGTTYASYDYYKGYEQLELNGTCTDVVEVVTKVGSIYSDTSYEEVIHMFKNREFIILNDVGDILEYHVGGNDIRVIYNSGYVEQTQIRSKDVIYISKLRRLK